MTSDVSINLRTVITCAVCFKRYTIPKKLNCQHTFCETCLDRLVGINTEVVECPTCLEIQRLPPDGVMGLQTNRTMLELMNTVPMVTPYVHTTASHTSSGSSKALPGSDKSVGCQVCLRSGVEQRKCLHCDKAICNQCIERHSKHMRGDILQLEESTATNATMLLTAIRDAHDTSRLADYAHFQCSEVRTQIKNAVDESVDALKKRKQELFQEIDSNADNQSRAELNRRRIELQSIISFCQDIAKCTHKSQEDLETVRQILVGYRDVVHSNQVSCTQLCFDVELSNTSLQRAVGDIATLSRVKNPSASVGSNALPKNDTASVSVKDKRSVDTIPKTSASGVRRRSRSRKKNKAANNDITKNTKQQSPPQPAPQGTSQPAPQSKQQKSPQPTPQGTSQPAPQGTSQPAPQGTSQPAPQSKQQESPQPTPQESQQESPEPTQQESPQPTPQESPQPAPEESPQPAPQPTPQPAPEESPQPTPQESPEPAPQESPQPAPQPIPQESPEPTPQESQQPTPQESPEPAPEESPQPTPQESPEPTPQESQQPTPQESPEPAPEESPAQTPHAMNRSQPGSERTLEYDEVAYADIDRNSRLSKLNMFFYFLLFTAISYHNLFYVDN